MGTKCESKVKKDSTEGFQSIMEQCPMSAKGKLETLQKGLCIATMKSQ